MLNKIGNVVHSLVVKILKFFFGDLSWTPPIWLKMLFFPVIKLFTLDKILYKKSKSTFYLFNLFFICLILGGIKGYFWYKNLPKPNYVKFSVSNIIHTELKPDSLPKPLNITFDSSAAKIESVGKEIKKGIFVSPEIKGKWSWLSDKNLNFEPTNDWEVGQKYTVKLEPEIFAKHIILEKNTFEFTTPKIKGEVIDTKFYEDPTDPNLKQAVVSFKFTHPINKADLESRVDIGISQVNQITTASNLKFKVLYNDLGNEAYVRSENLKIPDRDSVVFIKLKKDLHALRGGTGTDTDYESTVNIPGVDNYFKIENIFESIITNPKTYKAERFISISSTAAVKSQDLTNGLEILLLPIKPKDENQYDEYNYYNSCWNSPAEVPQELINKAEKLKFENQPNEEDLMNHLFKYKADEDRCLLVKVKAGTRSFSGYALSEDRNFLVTTGQFTKEAKILHDGVLLAASGSKKLSIMARNQKNLRFTIYRIFPQAVNHLITQTYPYNTFQNPSFNYNFGPENISEIFKQDTQLAQAEPGLPQYTSFDFSNFITDKNKYQGLFMLTVQGYDQETKTFSGNQDSRLVLVSDFGLLVKTNKDLTKNVFAMSFSGKNGVSDAQIEIIGKNGLPVYETKTDLLGSAQIPDLTELNFDKEPVAIVIRKGNDFSFIPWYKADRELSFGQFDVGGISPSPAAKSLIGYLFSDRGIYRPGEEARFGIILKNTNWTSLDSVPVELNVVNPRGTIIKSEKIAISDPGFSEFKLQIPEQAVLGGYSLELNLIKDKKSAVSLGSTSFKIEEFMPDRLKIATEFNKNIQKGWLKPNELGIKTSLKNLFGTPAAGNKIKTTIKLYPSLPNFSDYSEFTFFDPLKTKNSFDEDLGEVITDDSGEAKVDLNLSKYEQGIFYLRVLSEGFEKDGGRSVLTNLTTIVSPLDHLVGWKSNADLNYLKLNSAHEVELIVLDQDLKISAKNLKIQRIKKEYVSILSRQPNGDLAYKSVEKEILKEKENLNLEAKINKLKLITTEPGEFKYIITDESGMVLNTIYYFVSGEGNVSRELERNAELKIKTDKKDYASGSEIEINIQAPYTGTGLITIEKDKVYSSKWFNTNSTNSIQKITVPEGLEGNAYINVSFVRALDSQEIYMSPLSYGVVPFSVSREKRTENLRIIAPEKIIPGNELNIELLSDNPTKVVVFTVDEGIHQVARYKQPDPLSHIFRKQALGVSTAQIVDLLIPEFDIAAKLAGVGGDEDGLLGKFKNPFKRKTQPPVAFWSSLIDFSGSHKVSFKIPDYFNGNLKIYAVSVNPDRIGISNANTLVQNDIVLQPSAPLMVTPDDKFSVSTTVANTTQVKQNIKVQLKLDEKLKNISPNEKNLLLEPGKEELVNFELVANEQLGSSELKFIALTDKIQSQYTIDLSVRPASSKITKSDSGIIQVGEKERIISLSEDYFKEYNERELTISNSPLAWVTGLSRFLENYPHGCTEQITSQAFARLSLLSNPEFSVDKDKTLQFIDKTFLLLATRQNSDGSISLWNNSEFTPDAAFPSVYAARFIQEAKDAGFYIPEILDKQTKYYLKELAAGNSIDDEGFFLRANATYILARAGIVTSNYLNAMKEDLVNAKLQKSSSSLVKLFMAATYQILKLDEEAEKLIKSVNLEYEEIPQNMYYMSKLAFFSLYLDILSRHFPEIAKNIDQKIISNYLKQINSEEYNTFSSSMFISAILKYSELLASSSNTQIVAFSDDGLTYIPQTLADGKIIYRIKVNQNTKLIKVSSSSLPVYYQLSETGFKKPFALKQIRNGYEITREYLNQFGNPVTEFKQGDDIYVHLSFRALAGILGSQSAIVDLLPAGLEVSGGTSDLSGINIKNIVTNFYPISREAREDRVILIGSVSSDVSHFVYKVKATSSGLFTVPLASIEAMYNQKTIATTELSKVEIRK